MSAPKGMPFAVATGVTAVGDGRYAAVCDVAWSAPGGPNGGYLAALILRAMIDSVGDGEKSPRSLTCHYLRPPVNGPIEIQVRIERAGRAVTALTARLVQDGALCVTAIGAFGVQLPSALDYDDIRVPSVPAPETIEPSPFREGMPLILKQLDCRPALGPAAFSGADEALTGGWISVREGPCLDAVAVAMYVDGWLPAPFTRVTAPIGAPTIDLTIHFRRRLPVAGVDPTAPVFIEVRSHVSAEGYCDEDTLIWARDGTLIAQSRQLALLRP